MSIELKFFHYKTGFVDIQSFCAEHKDLDRYVKETMSQWESSNVTRNYLTLDVQGNCVGVFSLSASTLKDTTPEVRKEGNFPNGIQLPTIKIGRFVVDNSIRGKGVGREMLKKCIYLFIEASKTIGVVGLTVDAKDETDSQGRPIYGYYEKFGFKRLTSEPQDGCWPMILYTGKMKKQYPALFEQEV